MSFSCDPSPTIYAAGLVIAPSPYFARTGLLYYKYYVFTKTVVILYTGCITNIFSRYVNEFLLISFTAVKCI